MDGVGWAYRDRKYRAKLHNFLPLAFSVFVCYTLYIMRGDTESEGNMKFSEGNTKLQKTAEAIGVSPKRVWSFNMLAGHTCPYARDCKAWVTETPEGGRTIHDSPLALFRCYAASMEVRLPDTYALHKGNTDAMRTVARKGYMAVADALDAALHPSAELVRFHSDGGDFFSWTYFRGVMELTTRRRGCRFYFYTKALPLIQRWVKSHPDGVDLSRGILTPNVMVTASRGGSRDDLIDTLKMREARVVMYPEQVGKLPIDKDDTHAALPGGSFCLVIHAAQKAGTETARQWDKIRRGYVTF